jgi:hypothetical protein
MPSLPFLCSLPTLWHVPLTLRLISIYALARSHTPIHFLCAVHDVFLFVGRPISLQRSCCLYTFFSLHSPSFLFYARALCIPFLSLFAHACYCTFPWLSSWFTLTAYLHLFFLLCHPRPDVSPCLISCLCPMWFHFFGGELFKSRLLHYIWCIPYPRDELYRDY